MNNQDTSETTQETKDQGMTTITDGSLATTRIVNIKARQEETLNMKEEGIGQTIREKPIKEVDQGLSADTEEMRIGEMIDQKVRGLKSV